MKRNVFFLVAAAWLGALPIVLAAPVPANRPANYPPWWFQREVIPQSTTPPSATPAWPGDYRAADDYGVANIGQLKHLATQAAAELNHHVPGGAGAEINALIASWSAAPAGGVNRDDYATLNLGQLKAVAKLFYDRLIAANFVGGYPWANGQADDYAHANLGQLKYLFSFELFLDSDGDGMPDSWEMAHGLNPADSRDGQLDWDGDGLSNLAEFLRGTNPDSFDAISQSEQGAVRLQVFTRLE